MTGLGVAEAASDAAAEAEAVSLGVAVEVAAASLFACWPHAASRAPRASMRCGTLQLPPYRMFVVVCILLGTTATKHHYSDTSLLYASNISAPAEVPPPQNLCHGLAFSVMS